MTEDSFFRWISMSGIVAGACLAGYYRGRAHTGEPLERREEGVFLLTRPLGLIALIGLAAYLINPSWMAWSTLPMPTAARWVGVGVGIANLLFVWWVLHTLGKNITDTVVTRHEHTLVTTGPYRWIRHPFYVSLLFGAAAYSLISTSWFFLLVGCTAFVMLALRARIEEAKLVDRFGDDYRDYMRRTGRFIPRLVRTRSIP